MVVNLVKSLFVKDQTLFELELSYGIVIIRSFNDIAPVHCCFIKNMVNRGNYDKVGFKRVIRGYMVQTGSPRGNIKPLKGEFSNLSHKRGTCTMAREDDPDSALGQIIICLRDAPELDGHLTIWGEVVSGMEFVDKIKYGYPKDHCILEDPDRIISFIQK